MSQRTWLSRLDPGPVSGSRLRPCDEQGPGHRCARWGPCRPRDVLRDRDDPRPARRRGRAPSSSGGWPGRAAAGGPRPGARSDQVGPAPRVRPWRSTDLRDVVSPW